MSTRQTRMLVPMLILGLTVLICVNVPLYADRGSIPFEENVQIFEPNQRAMIAWNGYEEILLLTTDLYASESTKVLEVLPLPSEPVVTKGDIEVFQKATDLINKKLAKSARLSESRSKTRGIEKEEMVPAGEITFHEKIGAHDISVAHVLNSQGFIDWVDTYLKFAGVENPKIPEELKTVIAEYLEEGFGWFVFDVVLLERESKTNEVIQYRFKTDFLFYPLKITRSEEGDTIIDLLILTPETGYDYKFTGIPKEKIGFLHWPISLKRYELRNLNEEMYELLGRLTYMSYGPWLHSWRIKGKLSSFKEDLIVEGQKMVELMDAIEIGDTETVKVLLDAGALEDATDVGDRMTAMMHATRHGHIEIVKLLLDEGVYVNARNNEGATALMLTSQEGHTALASLLIDAGADVNAQEYRGITALIFASQYGHTEIVKLLIEEGADVNARDKRGHTAFWWAYQYEHTEVLHLLRRGMGE